MKSVKRLSATMVLPAALVLSVMSADAGAQYAIQSAHAQHIAVRKANHKLEREVRNAFAKSHLDESEILIGRRAGGDPGWGNAFARSWRADQPAAVGWLYGQNDHAAGPGVSRVKLPGENRI
jgi:hypothetical protein